MKYEAIIWEQSPAVRLYISKNRTIPIWTKTPCEAPIKISSAFKLTSIFSNKYARP